MCHKARAEHLLIHEPVLLASAGLYSEMVNNATGITSLPLCSVCDVTPSAVKVVPVIKYSSHVSAQCSFLVVVIVVE